MFEGSPRVIVKGMRFYLAADRRDAHHNTKTGKWHVSSTPTIDCRFLLRPAYLVSLAVQPNCLRVSMARWASTWGASHSAVWFGVWREPVCRDDGWSSPAPVLRCVCRVRQRRPSRPAEDDYEHRRAVSEFGDKETLARSREFSHPGHWLFPPCLRQMPD